MASHNKSLLSGGCGDGSIVKRKRNSLTIGQKFEILHKIQKGELMKNLCVEYGVGLSTIYEIKKQCEKLLAFNTESDCTGDNVSTVRKSMHGANLNDHDKVVYEWLRQQRREGVSVSGPMLIEKAKQIYNALNISEPCKFSSGWLHKFKHRHGIRHLKTYCEKLSTEREAADRVAADREVADKYISEMYNLVRAENLTPEQMYSAHEAGLLWRYLPRNMLTGVEQRVASGIKDPKERITFLTCANAAGTHKCKLLVVGNSINKRALKGVKNLPVHYSSNKLTWITREITSEWFDNFAFEARVHCRKVGLPENCKIVLFMNNCLARPNVDHLVSHNVFVTYLPPNCTSLLQPKDQGIIRNMKCNYRNEFMRHLVSSCTDACDVEAFKEAFTIKAALWAVACAWDNVLQSTLKNSWHNLWPDLMLGDNGQPVENQGFNVSSEKSQIEDLLQYAKDMNRNYTQNLKEIDIVTWMNCDDNIPIMCQLTEEEVSNLALNSKPLESDDSDSDSDMTQEKISMDEGIRYGELYLRFLEQRSFVTQKDIINVYKVQEKMIKKRSNDKMQVSLQDLFKKASEDISQTVEKSFTPSKIPLKGKKRNEGTEKLRGGKKKNKLKDNNTQVDDQSVTTSADEKETTFKKNKRDRKTHNIAEKRTGIRPILPKLETPPKLIHMYKTSEDYINEDFFNVKQEPLEDGGWADNDDSYHDICIEGEDNTKGHHVMFIKKEFYAKSHHDMSTEKKDMTRDPLCIDDNSMDVQCDSVNYNEVANVCNVSENYVEDDFINIKEEPLDDDSWADNDDSYHDMCIDIEDNTQDQHDMHIQGQDNTKDQQGIRIERKGSTKGRHDRRIKREDNTKDKHESSIEKEDIMQDKHDMCTEKEDSTKDHHDMSVETEDDARDLHVDNASTPMPCETTNYNQVNYVQLLNSSVGGGGGNGGGGSTILNQPLSSSTKTIALTNLKPIMIRPLQSDLMDYAGGNGRTLIRPGPSPTKIIVQSNQQSNAQVMFPVTGSATTSSVGSGVSTLTLPSAAIPIGTQPGSFVVIPPKYMSLIKPKPKSANRTKPPRSSKQRKLCSCTKSQCLKQYCDCFASGAFCDNCHCTNCFNNEDHKEERQKAITACLDRNQNAFQSKKCNCKRSGCLKKYCQCYEAGISCSTLCNCVGCMNPGVEDIRLEKEVEYIDVDAQIDETMDPSVDEKGLENEEMYIDIEAHVSQNINSTVEEKGLEDQVECVDTEDPANQNVNPTAEDKELENQVQSAEDLMNQVKLVLTKLP
ncbi:uncharacterized protein [Procambarus clarkii]|uniref:uncharacterized protein n=1 Tax=Procambarus clarkii TaxID=6728 RepID=UPI001E6767DF|nr:uncharacterized protein LOC123757999 [Procambarus clarkii]XP_045598061.1 uncharacterized protein LOC123757999 [Procambarus clarkii]